MAEKNPLQGKSLEIDGQTVEFGNELLEKIDFVERIEDGLVVNVTDKEGTKHKLTLVENKKYSEDENQLWFDVKDANGEKIMYFAFDLKNPTKAHLTYKSYYDTDQDTYKGIHLSSAVFTLIAEYLKKIGIKKITGTIPDDNLPSLKSRLAATNLQGEKLNHHVDRKKVKQLLNRLAKLVGKRDSFDTRYSITTKLDK